jgi:uncharacterized membrane protein
MNKADKYLAERGHISLREAYRRGVLRSSLMGILRLAAMIIGFSICVAVGIWLLQVLVR